MIAAMITTMIITMIITTTTSSYSMFCTCSRICSISTFISTAVRVVSRSCDFEDSVLASRLNSCIRKSSRRPAGSVPASVRASLHDVARQPVELLGNIEALQQQGDFLLDTVRVDLGPQLVHALGEALPDTRLGLGQPGAKPGDHFPQRGAARLDQRRQPRALARARAGKISQGRARITPHGFLHLLGVVIGFAQHAGPAQQFDGVDRRGLSKRRIELAQPRQQAVERRLVDVQAHRIRLRPALLQRAVDLTALEIACQRLAQFRFQRAAAVRQAQRRIEVAVIHTADLAHERAKRAGALVPGEPSHACYHWTLMVYKAREV